MVAILVLTSIVTLLAAEALRFSSPRESAITSA